MNTKIKNICFLLAFLPVSIIAQNPKILLPITKHEGFGPFEHMPFSIFWNAPANDSTDEFKHCFPAIKNIPELKGLKRGYIIFQYDQFIYQNYIAGKISKNDYEQFKQNASTKFDESVLTKKEIKCYVNIFKGVNEAGETICILDINNNLDLADDKFFIPIEQLSDTSILKTIVKQVYCERFLNHKILVDRAPVLLFKMGDGLGYNLPEYATANFIQSGKKYTIALRPHYFIVRSFRRCAVAVTNKLRQEFNEDSVIKKEEIFYVGKEMYRNLGVEVTDRYLVLEKIKKGKNASAQVGFYAPKFSDLDIITKVNVSLENYKGKYLFIDFWGTWCAPCRAELPNFVTAYKQIDTTQIMMIGIMSSEKRELLKSFLEANSVTWPQLYSDDITRMYGINQFPTNLLINPKGKIIAKDLNTEMLAETLDSFIQKQQ